MHKKTRLFLLLGSNLKDRLAFLYKAQELLIKKIGSLKEASDIYETEPWGKEDQPNYYNQVLILNSEFNKADSILKKIIQIEKSLGRERKELWDARTIDIDILFLENFIINKPELCIPHPRLHERRFVLQPLFDIAKDFIHPVFKKSIRDLLRECKDNLKVKKLILNRFDLT